jgi:hypothetical protein
MHSLKFLLKCFVFVICALKNIPLDFTDIACVKVVRENGGL